VGEIERNDPCPCGSGKKYKRCCLPLGRIPTVPTKGSDWPVSRLAIARHIEYFNRNPEQLGKIGSIIWRFVSRGLDDRWTLGKVRKMDTNEIIGKLRSLGIKFEVEEFKRQALNYISAVRLADDRYYTQDIRVRGSDEDFIWMAVIELWKRIIPERYNVEMIDDFMQEGYIDIEEGNYKDGIEKWEKAWVIIKSIVPKDIKSVEEADGYIGILTQLIHNWCQDFEMELRNAAVTLKDQAFYAKRIKFCRDFCQTFPNSNELIIVNMLRFEAESYAYLGDIETADKLFQSLTEKFPNHYSGYIGWGDIYSDFFEDRRFPVNFDKAEKIYKLGLDRCSTEKDVFVNRLAGLKKRKVKTDPTGR